MVESRMALRRACARLSVFLEAPGARGCVLSEVPTAAEHAAASYSGHNFRPEDWSRFSVAAGEAGVSLTEEEEWLGRALGGAQGASGIDSGATGVEAACAALDLAAAAPPAAGESLPPLVSASGLKGSDPECEGSTSVGCVAVARGLGKAEAAATLSHELMHGLFYSCSALRRRCQRFWEEEADAGEQAAWISFLREAGYDPEAPDLAANELLAYMTTEVELFTRKAPGSRQKGGRAPRQEEPSRNRVLRELQARFNSAVGPDVPLPLPALCGTPIPLQSCQLREKE